MHIFLKLKSFFNTPRGQTAVELAIFGGVLIFVIGALINYILVFSYGQAYQMRAFRAALAYSYGKDTQGCGGGTNFPLEQSSISMVMIDDRNMPDLSNPLGIMQRSPVFGVASLTFGRSLLLSPAYGVRSDLPKVTFLINNKKYSFTTAGYGFMTNCNQAISQCSSGFKRMVIKGVKNAEGNVEYGKGSFDPRLGAAGKCDPNEPKTCIWYQWIGCDCNTKYFRDLTDWDKKQKLDTKGSVSAVDLDCDNKEEQVLNSVGPAYNQPNNTWIWYLDYQEGEINLTVDDWDLENGDWRWEANPPAAPLIVTPVRQGLQPEGAATYQVLKGTKFRKAYTGSRTTYSSASGSVNVKRRDFITRVIQLNTTRHNEVWYEGIKDPWERTSVYFRGLGVSCKWAASPGQCEAEANNPAISWANQACFDRWSKKFYIRSDIKYSKRESWTVRQ